MNFGEASVAELICAYSEDLEDSFEFIGVPVTYISVTQGRAVENKDRLGAVMSLDTTASESIKTIMAGVVVNPSDEIRRTSGVKGQYDILLSVQTSSFDAMINKESDKFIVHGIECRVEDFKLGGMVGMYTGGYVIGLRSN